MLHIQEPFAHNSSLLMSPPIAVVVQPQPSTSTRTLKVIEQLSQNFDSIQKEIASTRLQVNNRRTCFFFVDANLSLLCVAGNDAAGQNAA